MPDKTTTLFKNLNNQEKDTIKKLMEKNCDRLTQNDLHSRGAKKAPDFNRGMNSRKPRP